MRHRLVFATLLVAATVVGCGGSTPVDKPTSNPVEYTGQEQKAEDQKGQELVNEASEAAR